MARPQTIRARYLAFDPEARFVAAAYLRSFDPPLKPGDPFDRKLVSERRLRWYYMRRKIEIVPGSSKQPLRGASPMPAPPIPSNPQPAPTPTPAPAPAPVPTKTPRRAAGKARAAQAAPPARKARKGRTRAG